MFDVCEGGVSMALSQPEIHADASVAITDVDVIDSCTRDPQFPFLVSFPRTGSHWLRLLMELYFEQPSLVRTFYFHDQSDYRTLHTHDLDLGVCRTNVIYLYRDPVATVYSQLRYHQEDPDDVERITHWADLYGRHLHKWLISETFTIRKTVIRYEHLRADIHGEFAKVTSHFRQPLDDAKLGAVTGRVTKEEVRRVTPHDPQVVSTVDSYSYDARCFQDRHATLVYDAVLRDRVALDAVFAFDLSCVLAE